MSDAVRRTAVKVLAFVMLVLVAWPIPRMVTFCNPGDGVILGCFTPPFFLLLTVYSIGVLVWALLTVWAVMRLNGDRMEALRSMIRKHPALFWQGFTLVLLAAGAVRAAELADWLVYPSMFANVLRFLPFEVICLLSVLAYLILDTLTLEAIEADIQIRLDRPLTWLNSRRLFGRNLNWMSITAAGTLGALVLFFLLEFIGSRIWDLPLSGDGAWHVYLGQHVLNGGTPYVTAIYHFPPPRFIVSILWNVIPHLFGLPLLLFIRGLDLAVGCGVLVLCYAIGKQLTRRRVGGLLAATIMVGTEHIQEVILSGPTFRLTTTLFMLLGVWLGQKRRWFWAGLFITMSGLLWTPGLVMTGAMGIAAFYSQRELDSKLNIQALLHVAVGVLTTVLLMAINLVIFGALKEGYEQIVVVHALFIRDLFMSGSEAASAGSTLFNWRVWRKIVKIGDSLPGDTEITILMVFGVLLAPLAGGVRSLLREPTRAVVFLSMLAIWIMVTYDYKGDYRDSIMLVSGLTVFGALAVVWLLASPGGWGLQTYPHLGRLLGITGVMIIVLVGSGDSRKHISAYADPDAGSYRAQVEFSQEITALLSAEDTINTIGTGNAWFLVLTGRDNAVPLRKLDYKMPILEATGWTIDAYYLALHANKPVIILGGKDETLCNVPEWLFSEYVHIGQLGEGQDTQVFVRADRLDLMEVFARYITE